VLRSLRILLRVEVKIFYASTLVAVAYTYPVGDTANQRMLNCAAQRVRRADRRRRQGFQPANGFPCLVSGAGRSTVDVMDAAEHWQAWLHRYGGDYLTDEARRAAYREFKANLAQLADVFSPEIEQDGR
jgi:hypothetical protein